MRENGRARLRGAGFWVGAFGAIIVILTFIGAMVDVDRGSDPRIMTERLATAGVVLGVGLALGGCALVSYGAPEPQPRPQSVDDVLLGGYSSRREERRRREHAKKAARVA